MTLIARLAALALLTSLAACGEQPLSGPPEIRLGRDECAECGMIINEDRYSASMVIDDRGQRTPLLFDDIGDMLDHERLNPGLRVLARYVHDHPTRAWIDAATAHYIRSDELHTPMGSGLAAFSSRAEAEAIPARDPAAIMNFPELAAFRQRWMEDRYGKPDSPPTPAPPPDK